MKTIRFFYLTLFGALAVPAATDAQIRDNDASMSVLAVQCAMSSGFSASEYEDYCRRLAKTLSLLSSAQQTRVFGYLPMPGAASLGDEEPVTSGAGSTESTPLPSSSNAVGTAESAPATTAPSNSVLDMVGRFNSLFDGTGSTSNGSTTSTPLVSPDAGSSVGSTTTTTVAATTSPTGDSPTTPDASTTTAPISGTASTQPVSSSSGWSSLKAWFEAAEAAYKSGTLSSFLKGGN